MRDVLKVLELYLYKRGHDVRPLPQLNEVTVHRGGKMIARVASHLNNEARIGIFTGNIEAGQPMEPPTLEVNVHEPNSLQKIAEYIEQLPP
jgi:hypothetical protein